MSDLAWVEVTSGLRFTRVLPGDTTLSGTGKLVKTRWPHCGLRLNHL